MSHKKFGPDQFSRFDVYWTQKNKQTDKLNLYIEEGEGGPEFIAGGGLELFPNLN